MNWILLVMAAIGAAVAAMILGGLLTPRTRVSTRSLVTSHGMPEVYALLRAADGPPRWCANLPTLRLEQDHAPHRLHFTVLDDDGAEVGAWQITIDANDGQTVASITETVTVANPVLRFVRSVGGSGGRSAQFLDAVAQQLEHR